MSERVPKKGPTRVYLKVYNVLQLSKPLPHRAIGTYSPTKYKLFCFSYMFQKSQACSLKSEHLLSPKHTTLLLTC